MKTYFTSVELPHQWAHQLAPKGRCPSSLSFDGRYIFSYGMQIGRIIERNGKKAYLLTEDGYSVTTARHKNMVWQAVPNSETIFKVTKLGSLSDVISKQEALTIYEYSLEQAKSCAEMAARARSNKDSHISRQAGYIRQAQTVSDFFGLRRTAPRIDHLLTAVARIKKDKARDEAKEQAKAEQRHLERIQEWLNGAQYFPHAVERVYLRKRSQQENGVEIVQTSRGVEIPIADAQLAFRFVMTRRNKPWHRNGSTFKVGEYQLDSIDENGVLAGCHKITWEELERFGKEQNWL